MANDEEIYPAALADEVTDISPRQFESVVVGLLRGAGIEIDGLEVTSNEMLAGVDGTYQIDATVRFEVSGMKFLVIVEAKRHKNPIKRELVQALHSKMVSVGAQKAVMVSTAPYQTGALNYARVHGIGLMRVVDESLYVDMDAPPPFGRMEIPEQLLPRMFVAEGYVADDTANVTVRWTTGYGPTFLVDYLLAGVHDAASGTSAGH